VLRVNSPAAASPPPNHPARGALDPEGKARGGFHGQVALGRLLISTYSDRFSPSNHITGSIGVFGMFLNFQRAGERQARLTFDTEDARFADAATITRPKTADELAIFQRR